MSASIFAYHYHYPSLLVRMKDIGAVDETLLRAIFKSCGDVYDVFRDGREIGITSADKEDIAERLGITLEDEE